MKWTVEVSSLSSVVLNLKCSLGYKIATMKMSSASFENVNIWQYFFKSIVLESRLEPRPGPTYVGPDLGSSLFAIVKNTDRSVSRLKWVNIKKPKIDTDTCATQRTSLGNCVFDCNCWRQFVLCVCSVPSTLRLSNRVTNIHIFHKIKWTRQSDEHSWTILCKKAG